MSTEYVHINMSNSIYHETPVRMQHCCLKTAVLTTSSIFNHLMNVIFFSLDEIVFVLVLLFWGVCSRVKITFSSLVQSHKQKMSDICKTLLQNRRVNHFYKMCGTHYILNICKSGKSVLVENHIITARLNYTNPVTMGEYWQEWGDIRHITTQGQRHDILWYEKDDALFLFPFLTMLSYLKCNKKLYRPLWMLYQYSNEKQNITICQRTLFSNTPTSYIPVHSKDTTIKMNHWIKLVFFGVCFHTVISFVTFNGCLHVMKHSNNLLIKPQLIAAGLKNISLLWWDLLQHT